jgi:hypothetical protein
MGAIQTRIQLSVPPARTKGVTSKGILRADMNIEQYSNKFIELLRYAPNSVPNEETKVERFL